MCVRWGWVKVILDVGGECKFVMLGRGVWRYNLVGWG